MAISPGKRLLEMIPSNNQYERIWLLAKTDFKLKYYDTFLGFIWTILNPLFRLAIFYYIFTYIFDKQIPNYALHIFSGLILWMFFQESTKKGLSLLKTKRYLYENIEFSKLDLYTSSVLSSLMILIINILVYFVVSMFFHIPVNGNLLFVPLQIITLCILVYGIILILSIINIYMKDINQIWDMILLAWFWINPIFYAKTVIFDTFPILKYINPLAGIIINTREGILYGNPPDWGLFVYDLGYSLVVLAIGLILFRLYFHKAAEKL
ncbi:MAG: ABC transporter permease [Bacteroidetes bacterium]|nr:ABC transporter permease [Bacteroidota bacterium]